MFLDGSLKIFKVRKVIRLLYSISALPYHLSEEKKNRNNSIKQDYNQHNSDVFKLAILVTLKLFYNESSGNGSRFNPCGCTSTPKCSKMM